MIFYVTTQKDITKTIPLLSIRYNLHKPYYINVDKNTTRNESEWFLHAFAGNACMFVIHKIKRYDK